MGSETHLQTKYTQNKKKFAFKQAYNQNNSLKKFQ